MKDSHELARLCNVDLGREDISSDEVRIALLTGVLPERLSEEEKNDMFATLVKGLDGGV